MTKLTYTVGNEEIATYEAAKQRAAETGLPAVPKYTPIVEESKTDPKRLAKIQAYFARRMAERAAEIENNENISKFVDHEIELLEKKIAKRKAERAAEGV